MVLALPRGGVPVGYEVAWALDAPLDVFLVRKLGAPGNEELAMGAIASGGVVVLNDDVVRGLAVAPEAIERVADREGRELERRERAYREGRGVPDLADRTVIVVDDGLATGSSMRAAILALRRLQPAKIIVAVPAAPEPACRELAVEADEAVCATSPSPFLAVGRSYWDFTQTTDDEVRDLLRRAWARSTRAAPGPRNQVDTLRASPPTRARSRLPMTGRARSSANGSDQPWPGASNSCFTTSGRSRSWSRWPAHRRSLGS